MICLVLPIVRNFDYCIYKQYLTTSACDFIIIDELSLVSQPLFKITTPQIGKFSKVATFEKSIPYYLILKQ